MSIITENIAKGDTSTVWRLGHLDADGVNLDVSAGYVCKMAVEGTVIARTITAISDDNLYYLVSLTAAETATLAENRTYMVGMQLENSSYTPALVQETRQRIFITPNIVA